MRTGRDFAIISIGLLTTVALLWRCPQWLRLDAWWVAPLHHFFHASLPHLGVNCYSLYIILAGRNVTLPAMAAAYVCATLSWFCSGSDPVGISNIIFALIGMGTPALSDAWWRRSSTVVFLATNAALFLFPQVSAVTHLVSFALGCMCAMCVRLYKRLSDDFRRAAYNR